MAKPTRRESREMAFALLFEWSFKDETLEEIVEMAKLARGIEPDEFALSLAGKVIANCDELDALIERQLQGWKLSRLSRTALTVLRMSFCELAKFEGIPAGATINEAVELVKKYGTVEEAAYMNGVLGSFERSRGKTTEPDVPEVETVEDTEDTGDTGDTENTEVAEDAEIAEPAALLEEGGEVEEAEGIPAKSETQAEAKRVGGWDEPELLDDIVIEVE